MNQYNIARVVSASRSYKEAIATLAERGHNVTIPEAKLAAKKYNRTLKKREVTTV